MAYRHVATAVLMGGILGGALDLVFAVSFAGYNGVPALRVFQTIASGLLGSSAYTGGNASAALGVLCHFTLAVGWAAVFAALAAWKPAMLRSRLLCAVLFGLGVFLAMRLVVLPLSAYPRPVTFPPLATILDLLSHMFLFAGPIVAFASRAIPGPKGELALGTQRTE